MFLLQVKSGKAFLKEYYLKHRALSEKDLDELVAKSSMSYEQVRDWFSETARRAEEGTELFSDEEAEEEEEEEEATAEHADSEGEMEVKEQGEEASDDDCVEEDEKDAEEEEEEDEEIQEGSEGFSQSQPQAEEQT